MTCMVSVDYVPPGAMSGQGPGPGPEKLQEVRERGLANFSALKKTESQEWRENS